MNQGITLQELASVTSGKVVREVKPVILKKVITDTRTAVYSPDSVFFALKGLQHDAHHFLPSVIEKEPGCIVISDPQRIPESARVNVILVDNTLDALQRYAAFHRDKFSIPVLGITGSNGKTIVKEWLYQLMREDYRIIRSPKSYNSQVGVPVSLFLMDSIHELALIEAGISQPGEMVRLQKMIRPDTGILTHIGSAHTENFSGTEELISEKLKLFSSAKKLIYCSDTPGIVSLVKKYCPETEHITWSETSEATVRVTQIKKKETNSEITLSYNDRKYIFSIPFTDKASVINAVSCITYLLSENYAPEVIAERLLSLTPIGMRLEVMDAENNCILINDSYNSDANSLEIALDLMIQQKTSDRKTVILSDILQDRRSKKELYSDVARLINEKEVDRFIGIGNDISEYADLFPEGSLFFTDTHSFLRSGEAKNFRNETILVKGARNFGFEKIAERIALKQHETVLEINLDSMVQNLSYFRNKLNPGTKILVMVKAFSYGSGITEIAGFLEYNKVDYLAVAYADEGMELRKAGISLPIIVMNPQKSGFPSMFRNNLEPELYSLKILKEFFASNPPENTGIHLKIDTGMHRLGFDPEEIGQLCSELKSNSQIKVLSVFTHLVASESPEHDDFTRKQAEILQEAYEKISAAIGYRPIVHLLNSGGISRFPEYHKDMVRLGIGLYGIGSEADKEQLIPVGTFKTIISQIKNVKAGETVGYSRRGIIKKDTRIATIPLGYADGFSRSLSLGKGKVWIDGKPAPVVGNVCMDITMVDLSDIPDAKEGDPVIIFDPVHSVEELAGDMNTIPYEVLTSISPRVKRVYIRE